MADPSGPHPPAPSALGENHARGVPVAEVRELAEYRRTEYDWRDNLSVH